MDKLMIDQKKVQNYHNNIFQYYKIIINNKLEMKEIQELEKCIPKILLLKKLKTKIILKQIIKKITKKYGKVCNKKKMKL